MAWQIAAETDAWSAPGVSALDDNVAGTKARGESYDSWLVTPLYQGRPFPFPERVPRTLRLWGPLERPADVMPIYGALGVSDAFRDVVETLEPGRHEFFPVAILAPDSDTVVARYHILNICNRLQAVVFDHAVIVTETNLPGDRRYHVQHGPTSPPYPAFRSKDIEGRHLWRDASMYIFKFMSDELAATLERRRLTGWRKIGPYREL